MHLKRITQNGTKYSKQKETDRRKGEDKENKTHSPRHKRNISKADLASQKERASTTTIPSNLPIIIPQHLGGELSQGIPELDPQLGEPPRRVRLAGALRRLELQEPVVGGDDAGPDVVGPDAMASTSVVVVVVAC